jgi:islet cell auto antigen 1
MNSKYTYDKHAEHQDRTSLGKLRCKYWTTKQLVMKKLGREEDEFIIASDADVDAKLELLLTIKQSCQDLLRVSSLIVLERKQTTTIHSRCRL